MINKNKLIKITSLLLLLPILCVTAKITFTAPTSTLKVSANAKIVPKTKLTITTGTLAQGKNATLEGNNYTLNNASLNQETKTNVTASTGVLNPKANTLTSQSKTAATGGVLAQKVQVSGKNATLEGYATSFSKNTIILADADTLLEYSVVSNQPSVIVLNGGTVKLFNDLKFSGTASLVGDGIVDYNDRAMWLDDTPRTFGGTILHQNADIELDGTITITGAWLFSGIGTLAGHGHELKLAEGGVIIVQPHGVLTLHNVQITGLKANNISCCGPTATVIFSDSNLCLERDFSFTTGAMGFEHDVVIRGTSILSYQSESTLTVSPCSQLRMEELHFVYAPSLADRALFVMYDQSARFFIDGITLETTTTGMRLTKGTLLIDHKNFLINVGATSLSEGFGFGDGIANDDLSFIVKPGGSIDLVSGMIDYQNVNA